MTGSEPCSELSDLIRSSVCSQLIPCSVAEWLACLTQAQKGRVQIAAATLSGNSLRQTVHTQPTAGFMIHVTCRPTAKNRDQLRNPMLGNRVWATFLLSVKFRDAGVELVNEYAPYLSSSSSSWNIGRQAFSISVCRWQISLHPSHARTVVRECCKGDDESQWERGKFDPPPPKNPLTDGHQNLCR